MDSEQLREELCDTRKKRLKKRKVMFRVLNYIELYGEALRGTANVQLTVGKAGRRGGVNGT